ncbi:probable FBD-associated F-box protein At1g32375 [Sorghum bicolor]|nr:probable FBD-associated F-box protein At1g32375 [Sorghum bicolor]|eukprot:XP_021317443.1 probable FBD-associated F-box protein At1g32375 [Sorghum bicolor]
MDRGVVSSPLDHSPASQIVTRRLPPPSLMVSKEGRRRRRRRSGGEDRISGLPDELLHDILVRLRCARAAARTSVLSRRWRHLWADVPELVLVDGPDAPPPPSSRPASFVDTVDAALDAHAAPTLDRLLIALSASDVGSTGAIPAARAAPWLRFAAVRVAGSLLLLVPPRLSYLHPVTLQELPLPACARAKTITLKLQDTWLLRPAAPAPAPAGVFTFTALTALTILYGRMDGGELSALVSSTRCPCLRDLKLRLTLLDDTSDDDVVSIRSDTLRSLWFCIWTHIRRLR